MTDVALFFFTRGCKHTVVMKMNSLINRPMYYMIAYSKKTMEYENEEENLISRNDLLIISLLA